MVGIDKSQTRRWLKFSDAETADWRLYSMRQTADSGDWAIGERLTIWAVNEQAPLRCGVKAEERTLYFPEVGPPRI